jgi:thioredoxin
MASEKVKTFTDTDFNSEVKNGVVLVDFWAPWCAPCRRLAPTVDQLAEEYNGRITVAKMNIDENPMTPSRFMVRGIPTLLLFKNGDLKETVVGLAAKDDLVRLIDKHVA